LNERVLKDQEARDRIANDLDTCLLVEAGAGSGKTASLVTRMVNLIREGRCTMSSLAAVTFTRKAAAEMKARFQLEMEKACQAETDSGKKERLAEGLREIERCFIGTIHSFCALLLRERPLEAGLEPGFMEMDELEDRLFHRRVWNDYLQEVRLRYPEKLESLWEIDVEPQDLWYFYQTLSLYPEFEVYHVEVPFPDLTAVREKLDSLLDLAERRMPPRPLTHRGYDGLQQILKRALQRREFLGLDDDRAFLKLLTLMDREPKITLNRWHSSEEAREVKEEYELFRDQFIRPVLKAWREYRYHHIVSFVLSAVSRGQEMRLREQTLNYQDLLLLTADLLRNKPEVRQYFQRQYTHLLVDEFQDTDPLQAEIMFYLTGQDVRENDWRRLVPRPGSLFVVGDPKQSIYRFRRADIDTYNEVKTLLEKYGAVIRLTTNFRSVREIGQWNNQVFSRLFPDEADTFQAVFAELDTVREAEAGEAAGLRKITIPRLSGHRRAQIVEEDARRIAAWIDWAIQGGIRLARTPEEMKAGLDDRPRPRDFMILVRYKADLDAYARALEKMKLPYRLSGGGGLAGSDELKELIKLLQALLDLEDPVKLAAVLRGRFFGLSDDQLWRWRRLGGQFHINAEPPADLRTEDREIFSWVFDTLRSFHNCVYELPFSVALRKIINQLGVIPATAGQEMGSLKTGYLLQALELVAAKERAGNTAPSFLTDYLASLMDGGIEEEIDLDPGPGDEIRLMNLHKAKGLEAPVVFLAHPGRSVEIPPTVHIDRLSGRGYFVAQGIRGEYAREVLGQPVGWDEMALLEEKYLEAEEIRLLYVAATRARNLLIISTYPEKSSLSPWAKLEPFLNGAHELEEIGVEDAPTKLHTDHHLKVADIPAGPPAPPEEQSVGDGIKVVPTDESASGTLVPMAGEPEPDCELLSKAGMNFFGPDSPENLATYRLRSVKSLAGAGMSRPRSPEPGKGADWGQSIHLILEAVALDPAADLEILVTNVLEAEERDPAEKEEALRLVKGVISSPLWERMRKSRRRLAEVPFTVSELDAENSRETVTSGVIDLVFEEDGGWVIVDYKTDAVPDPKRLTELTEFYSPQVTLYRHYWEALTGTRVIEAGLYFISADAWVTV